MMQAEDTAGTHIHDSRNSGSKNCLGLITRQDFPPKCYPSEVRSSLCIWVVTGLITWRLTQFCRAAKYCLRKTHLPKTALIGTLVELAEEGGSKNQEDVIIIPGGVAYDTGLWTHEGR
ncbi:unnamed protein product [Rangifer tarandus platyrhynchus]|uniref:Uncharacterized protein n=2 Tax=Rangifer tarandus platyrhynchus TaxID=3082113 RepID=A0AC59ZYA7_RANTA|nr:unnamed protein product [Rangifer tarandus platyrhynchus]